MEFDSIEFTRHAVEQMFMTGIIANDVKDVIKNGKVIKSYTHDKPYPSYLILHYISERPLHVVAARNSETDAVTVITAYEPSSTLWENDYKNRK